MLRNPITGTIMVVHVDDPMAIGPPVESEKLFEALGMHIAPRPGQPLHHSEASVYLGTRRTKSRFVEMPKEGYIEGIRTIAEQAGCMSEAGEVRRRLASRTSRRQRTMRSISEKSCTPSTGRSLARCSASPRGGQT